ncbi:MAG: hypothetical protein KME06_09560 [Kastovskya adunca ATA6-11-RM4]|jgi:hypothetical protein|nr:hypothetical protein [Kastovskya adunca ATA6-11-RM4]
MINDFFCGHFSLVRHGNQVGCCDCNRWFSLNSPVGKRYLANHSVSPIIKDIHQSLLNGHQQLQQIDGTSDIEKLAEFINRREVERCEDK